MVKKTTCSYCGVGCGMLVSRDRKGKLHVEGDREHPVNRGMLCSKGMNLHYAMQDTSDRLLYPGMRAARSHPLQRVSWSTAMNRAAAVFRSIIRAHGPDAVAFYVSGQCLTEEYYVANKLVKGFLGTNNIDTNSRLCMSSAVTAYTGMLGEDAVPVSYEDIELSDCMFIAGANPAWCHPILFRRMEQHKALHPHIRTIVVDPRRTQTAAWADLHLQIKPGTDVVLYNAIARTLIEQQAIDEAFILDHTENFERYRETVFALTVPEAAIQCDVPERDIRLAASYISNAKGFLTFWAMGLNQSAIGVRKNHALISLHLITGHIGRPGSGPFSLTGQPNAMGGREVGGLATTLAAHRSIQNATHRAEVASFWGTDHISDKPGLTATEMIEALEDGRLKAIWIMCTNPLVSLPDTARVEAALRKARFVVVQEISSQSDTLPFADVVFPAAGHFEKEGTMTNSERRISHLQKIVDPPGEALPDVEILCRFAKGMGFPGFDYASPSEIFLEHARLTRGTRIDISGLTYEVLRSAGTVQWPVPEAGHAGTPRLFQDRRFYTSSGKARFFPTPADRDLLEPLTTGFPFVLTTGRIRDQWHTMTKTGKVNRLRQHIGRPFLEIHPEDAAVRGIADGDPVIISNARGEVRVCAQLTTAIKPGTLFLPMHWGKTFANQFARANNVTDMRVDPFSKEPDFKFSAVDVRRYEKPRERIVVVGAGAAAYRFICSFRARNDDDQITVFSKERDPFYNRVLLPEYVNGNLSWEKLQKFQSGEFEALNVNIELENEIVSIDRANQIAVDKYGNQYPYDKLILATGTRAHIPNDAPVKLPGVFTMRTRSDADRLRQFVRPPGHVLIVGGGLLGLELAVSLREMDIAVSVVQLGSRLMERQIDSLAADLLLGFIEECDIAVYLNDQVQAVRFEEDTETLSIQFRSGKVIPANALVYAVGTRPNIEFAVSAGIESGRGIVVNDHLQTSDPNIFAIGEIAEHRGKMLGITAAAEKQADVLAGFILGDIQRMYQGTVPMNILKMQGLHLCSIGIPEIPADGQGYEEILFVDRAMRYYKKCIIKDDRLVGAILIGDKTEFAEFKQLIDEGLELSDRRMQLLRSGKSPQPVVGKLVCACNQVGAGNIEQLIAGGCHSLSEICQRSGAGLGCGSCKPEIQAILQSSKVNV